MVMIHSSTRCHMPSFFEMASLVLEKNSFEVFYHIYGHGGKSPWLSDLFINVLIGSPLPIDASYKIRL